MNKKTNRTGSGIRVSSSCDFTCSIRLIEKRIVSFALEKSHRQATARDESRRIEHDEKSGTLLYISLLFSLFVTFPHLDPSTSTFSFHTTFANITQAPEIYPKFGFVFVYSLTTVLRWFSASAHSTTSTKPSIPPRSPNGRLKIANSNSASRRCRGVSNIARIVGGRIQVGRLSRAR